MWVFNFYLMWLQLLKSSIHNNLTARTCIQTYSHRYYNHNEVKIGEKNARKKGTFRKIYSWHCEACPFTLKVHRIKILRQWTRLKSDKHRLNKETWKKAPETKSVKNDVHLEQHFIKNMIFPVGFRRCMLNNCMNLYVFFNHTRAAFRKLLYNSTMTCSNEWEKIGSQFCTKI